MSIGAVTGNIVLVLGLLYVLGVIGLLISVATESQNGDKPREQQRQVELAQARERARAREAARRQQLLHEWADDRVRNRRDGDA